MKRLRIQQTFRIWYILRLGHSRRMRYPRPVDWRDLGAECARFVGACAVGALFVALCYYAWTFSKA